MLQETIGIAGAHFPQHHNPYTHKQSYNVMAGQDYMHNKRSMQDIFGTEEEVENTNRRSASVMSPGVDPSKTYNYKLSNIENTTLKSLKKEVHLPEPIKKINIPQERGNLTQRVVKEPKSDTEKLGANIQKTQRPKPAGETPIKFNITSKKKQSLNKVNLVYASEPEGEGKSASNLPEIPSATK